MVTSGEENKLHNNQSKVDRIEYTHSPDCRGHTRRDRIVDRHSDRVPYLKSDYGEAGNNRDNRAKNRSFSYKFKTLKLKHMPQRGDDTQSRRTHDKKDIHRNQ